MYLKITDGTTTFDFLGNDATDYFNLPAGKWAPAVSYRLDSGVSGNPYADVIERIPLYVASDTDVATILQNLNDLAALIDQAARWHRGEAVDPVIIRYSPNSSVNYLEAAILGPPDGQPAVMLPPNFVDDLHQDVVDEIVLQFVRRGLWLDGEVSSTSASTTSTGNPAVQQLSFSSNLTLPGPQNFRMQFSAAVTATDNLTMFVAWSDVNLVLAELESVSEANDPDNATYYDMDSSPPGGALWTKTAVSGASAGYVARADPNTLGEYKLQVRTSGTTTRLYAVYVVGRNNSSTVNWDVWAQAAYAPVTWPALTSFARSRGVRIAAGESNPNVYFLGLVSAPSNINAVEIVASPDATGTTGDEIDLDYAVIVDAAAQTSGVVRLNDISGGNAIQPWVHFYHRLLEEPQPEVRAGDFSSGSTYVWPAYMGSPIVFATTTTLFCGFGVNTNTNSWVLSNNAGTELNITLSLLRRRPGYLVAQ